MKPVLAWQRLRSSDERVVQVRQPQLVTLEGILGQLFNTTAMTISRAVNDVRPLLEAHGVSIPASTARFRTPADIVRFLDLDETKNKPTC